MTREEFQPEQNHLGNSQVARTVIFVLSSFDGWKATAMGWVSGQAHSEHLRKRVLAAVDRGERVFEVEPLFRSSVSLRHARDLGARWPARSVAKQQRKVTQAAQVRSASGTYRPFAASQRFRPIMVLLARPGERFGTHAHDSLSPCRLRTVCVVSSARLASRSACARQVDAAFAV